jgi:hypothetical protein
MNRIPIVMIAIRAFFLGSRENRDCWSTVAFISSAKFASSFPWSLTPSEISEDSFRVSREIVSTFLWEEVRIISGSTSIDYSRASSGLVRISDSGVSEIGSRFGAKLFVN